MAQTLAKDHLHSSQEILHFKENDLNQNGILIVEMQAKMREKEQSLGALLDRLLPSQRKVIDLISFAMYSPMEIVRKFNIPTRDVKTGTHVALIQLRSLLQMP